jgi:hypothetical protein
MVIKPRTSQVGFALADYLTQLGKDINEKNKLKEQREYEQQKYEQSITDQAAMKLLTLQNEGKGAISRSAFEGGNASAPTPQLYGANTLNSNTQPTAPASKARIIPSGYSVINEALNGTGGNAGKFVNETSKGDIQSARNAIKGKDGWTYKPIKQEKDTLDTEYKQMQIDKIKQDIKKSQHDISSGGKSASDSHLNNLGSNVARYDNLFQKAYKDFESGEISKEALDEIGQQRNYWLNEYEAEYKRTRGERAKKTDNANNDDFIDEIINTANELKGNVQQQPKVNFTRNTNGVYK